MINNRDLVVLLFLSSSTLLATTVGFAIAWVRARERALRAELEGFRIQPRTVATADSFERALDAIAVEVERISEGQRFVTRLLSERADAAPKPAPRLDAQRVITPH
jgi:hypothetical protein